LNPSFNMMSDVSKRAGFDGKLSSGGESKQDDTKQ